MIGNTNSAPVIEIKADAKRKFCQWTSSGCINNGFIVDEGTSFSVTVPEDVYIIKIGISRVGGSDSYSAGSATGSINGTEVIRAAWSQATHTQHTAYIEGLFEVTAGDVITASATRLIVEAYK